MRVSLKRYLAAHLLPYSRSLDRTNWNSKWYRTVKETTCPECWRREALYAYIQHSLLKDSPIDYLEFGVADGSSLRSWCKLNRSPQSRFFGFDTFTGLPENWRKKFPKGTFDQHGKPPKIEDSRLRFEVGLFQDTLPTFLSCYRPTNRLVIHNDSDLYSSTLYMLTMMDKLISPDTIVIFDEFHGEIDEYRAVFDYSNAYRKEFKIVASAAQFFHVAVTFH